MRKSPHTNINFIILSQISFYASTGYDLEIDKEHLEYLASLNTEQLIELAMKLSDDLSLINKSSLERVFKTNIVPAECAELIAYGATNKVIRSFFNANDSTISEWRRKVFTAPEFRARSLPSKKCISIWNDIEKLKNPLEPSENELINLAKRHRVSIGAIWAEIHQENFK